MPARETGFPPPRVSEAEAPRRAERVSVPAPKKATPSAPPPPDDDFARQYANFDEASVAPASENIAPDFAADVPAPAARRPDAEALKEAQESIPAALRNYVAERFQVQFDRLVPAGEARIFSEKGELGADTREAADGTGDELDEIMLPED